MHCLLVHLIPHITINTSVEIGYDAEVDAYEKMCTKYTKYVLP